LFNKVLDDVFGEQGKTESRLLSTKRKEYEEAGLLFDSEYNICRDVVAVGKASEQARTIVVHVSQLRKGIVAGRFSYTCEMPIGFDEDDVADAMQTVLVQKHYPAGTNTQSAFSWFPDDILLSHEPVDQKHLRKAVISSFGENPPKQRKKFTISTCARSGPRQPVDERLMKFASENAHQVAIEKEFGSAKSLVDGSSAAELATILGCETPPSRIECYVSSFVQFLVRIVSFVFSQRFYAMCRM